MRLNHEARGQSTYAFPMTGFKEVPDLSTLGQLVGIRIDAGLKENTVLELLRGAPNSDKYFTVVLETPTPLDALAVVVPRTRVFFNLARCKQLWGDAVVALAVYAMTQSAPAAFFAATVRKIYDNFMLLSDDEAEVVRDFFALSTGDPYRHPIPEPALRERFTHTTIPIDEVLDTLERKGIIVSHRGGGLTLAL